MPLMGYNVAVNCVRAKRFPTTSACAMLRLAAGARPCSSAARVVRLHLPARSGDRPTRFALSGVSHCGRVYRGTSFGRSRQMSVRPCGRRTSPQREQWPTPRSSLEKRIQDAAKAQEEFIAEQAVEQPSFRPFAAAYAGMGLLFCGGMLVISGYVPGIDALWQQDATNIPLYEGNPVVFLDVEIDGTPAGRITMQLRKDVAPATAENFRSLCTGQNDRRLTYAGTCFHRIIPGHLVQGGDVTHDSGFGSESIYGGGFADENFTLQHSGVGILSMANAGEKDTNGSQYFLTLNKLPYCDGKYVVFGNIIEGIEVLREIERVGSPGGVPRKSVKVARSGELLLNDAEEGPAARPLGRG